MNTLNWRWSCHLRQRGVWSWTFGRVRRVQPYKYKQQWWKVCNQRQEQSVSSLQSQGSLTNPVLSGIQESQSIALSHAWLFFQGPFSVLTTHFFGESKICKFWFPFAEFNNFQVEGITADQSLKSLAEVFRIVTEEYKQKPIVVDADELQRNPGEDFLFCALSLPVFVHNDDRFRNCSGDHLRM